MGVTGSQGPTGPTGAAGTTGPAFTNADSVDATILVNGNTIPTASTSFVFFVNNAGGAATITLPPASTLAGKQIRLQATNPDNGNNIIVVRSGQRQDLFFGERSSRRNQFVAPQRHDSGK